MHVYMLIYFIQGIIIIMIVFLISHDIACIIDASMQHACIKTPGKWLHHNYLKKKVALL